MNSSLSTLNLALAHRRHEDLGNRASRSARTYLDFIVDGKSVGSALKNADFDLVSVFTAEWTSESVERAARRLLLQEASDFPNARHSLYVCGECGDLGCGAVTVVVETAEDAVIWRDFGYENTYEGFVRFDKLRHLGPYRFSLQRYRHTIESAPAFIQQSPHKLQ